MIKEIINTIPVEIKSVSNWEVWNGEQWCDFTSIKKVKLNKSIKLVFSDGSINEGSINHKLQISNDIFKSLTELQIGDMVNDLKIVDKIYNDKDIELYDLLNVENGNKYQTNNVISHNCAFVKNVSTLWSAVQPTLSTGGKAIILSTPNGVGGFFHKLWVKAEEGTNGFNPIKLHWTVHPDRDQKWRDDQTIELGEKHAAQECDVSFLSSGATVIRPEILSEYLKVQVQEPKEKRGYDSSYWIWDYPDYDKDYMVVADVARGDSTDYSAFHVLEVESLTQVAEYKGKMPTKEFGNLLVNVATEYNTALLVIENANVGWAAIQPSIDRDYTNLYYSHKDILVVDPNIHINKGYDLKDKSQMVPGFTTSVKSRPLIISKMELYFRERAVTVRSTRLINELLVFIWNGHKAEAQSGYNDDLVMSFAIGMYVRDTALKLRMQGIALSKQAIGGIKKTGGMVDSFANGNGTHTRATGVYTSHNRTQNPWSMPIRGKQSDITWLL